MGQEEEPHEPSSTLYPGQAQGQQEEERAWTSSATGQLALQLRKTGGLRASVSSFLDTVPDTAQRLGSGLTTATPHLGWRDTGCSALSL